MRLARSRDLRFGEQPTETPVSSADFKRVSGPQNQPFRECVRFYASASWSGFHNAYPQICISLHNLFYIKSRGLQKKQKIFNFPLEKLAEMYYSNRQRKELALISNL